MMTSAKARNPLESLRQAGFGSLPKGWSVVEVGDLLSEDRGISVGVMYPGDHSPGGIPLIKVGDLAGNRINTQTEFCISIEKHFEYRRTELRGGELLLTLVGAIGQCAIVPTAMAGWNAARAVAVLRFKNPDDAEYIRLCLLSSPLQHLMQVWATTTVQATLNLKEIKQLPLPWPSTSERHRIVQIVGSLEEKIEVNRRTHEMLEAMARTLFRSWFVDFDPVRAKADGRRPPGLNAATAALFPDAFEDSRLGPIPKGWKLGTVSDLAEVNAWTLGKGDALDSLDYIEISEVSRGNVGNVVRYERGEEPSRARRRLKHGDTLLSTVRPDRGSYCLAINPPPTLIASTGFAVLSPRCPAWSFTHVVVTNPEFGDELGRLADGGAYPAVRPEVVIAQPVVVPPERVMCAFHDFAEPLFMRAEANRNESSTLAALRDGLLPKLLSGEVRTA